jgi:MFS family permease
VLGGIITRLGIGGMPFLLPLLYQIGLGFPAWQAGLLTMPQAAAAITMKAMSKSILARFGHRQVLILNTVLLRLHHHGLLPVGPGTPIWGILLLSFMQGFFSALQFTSMNTLVYADIDDRDASMANSIASTAQMMALSFGVAFASLLAGWFIGRTPQTDTVAFIRALHHSYLALGAVTILSSFIFWRLQPNDGNNVSNRAATPEAAGGGLIALVRSGRENSSAARTEIHRRKRRELRRLRFMDPSRSRIFPRISRWSRILNHTSSSVSSAASCKPQLCVVAAPPRQENCTNSGCYSLGPSQHRHAANYCVVNPFPQLVARLRPRPCWRRRRETCEPRIGFIAWVNLSAGFMAAWLSGDPGETGV